MKTLSPATAPEILRDPGVLETHPEATTSAAAPAAQKRPSLLARAVEAYRKWRLRRATYAELSALSDRMLADVGLDRTNLAETVKDMVESEARARRSRLEM